MSQKQKQEGDNDRQMTVLTKKKNPHYLGTKNIYTDCLV